MVSRSGYCQWRARRPSDRALRNAALDLQVASLHAHSKRSYGRGRIVHGLLCREHGYTGSASSVYRMLDRIAASGPPDATVPLHFAPGEAAQVDFGAGPLLPDPASGQPRRTWCFVMTLCFSRHQYVEFVFDQSVATADDRRGESKPPDRHCMRILQPSWLA
jgi:hypothetical protein